MFLVKCRWWCPWSRSEHVLHTQKTGNATWAPSQPISSSFRWLIFKVHQEFSYLLADQHTQNLVELKRCFLINLPLIVPLAATQTGSVVSQNSVPHNFLLTPSLRCLIETCSHTFSRGEHDANLQGLKWTWEEEIMSWECLESKNRKGNWPLCWLICPARDLCAIEMTLMFKHWFRLVPTQHQAPSNWWYWTCWHAHVYNACTHHSSYFCPLTLRHHQETSATGIETCSAQASVAWGQVSEHHIKCWRWWRKVWWSHGWGRTKTWFRPRRWSYLICWSIRATTVLLQLRSHYLKRRETKFMLSTV